MYCKKKLIAEIAFPCTLLLISIYLFNDIFAPGIPSTTDHATRFLSCWLTEQGIWLHGSILPWVSCISAGIPLNDLYPPGGNLLYVLLRAITFFTLSESSSYSLTVFLSWLIYVFGIYLTTRILFGKCGAFCASLILFFDAEQYGGYEECFSIGMWATHLSGGMFIISIGLIIKQFQNSTRFVSLLIPFFVMLAILTHVLSFVGLMLNFVIITSVLFLLNRDSTDFFQKFWMNSLSLFLGIGLTAWWLFPFIWSSDWTASFGQPLVPVNELINQIFSGTFIKDTHPVVATINLFGCLWGCFSGNRYAFALSIAYLCNYFIQSEFIYEVVFNSAYASIVSKIQMDRFSFFSKIFGWVLVGGLIQLIYHYGVQKLFCYETIKTSIFKRYDNRLQRAFFIFLPLIFISIIVFYAFAKFIVFHKHQFVCPNNFIMTTESYPPFHSDLQDIIKYLELIEDRLPNDEDLFNPIYQPKIGIQNALGNAFIPYLSPFGIVAPPYNPTFIFRTRSHTWDTIQSLPTMKYFLTIDKISEHINKWPGMVHLREFGESNIFWNENYKKNPLNIEGGAGYTRLITNSFHQYQIFIDNIPAQTEIRFPISRYRKWKAYNNGVPVPIYESFSNSNLYELGRYIVVKADPGKVSLHYHNEWIDWLSYSLSTITLMLIFILCYIMYWHYLFIIDKIKPILPYIAQFSKLNLLYIAILSISIYTVYAYHTSHQSDFWFFMKSGDHIGQAFSDKDNINDLEFGLYLGKDLVGKTLHSISIKQMPIKGSNFPIHQWSSISNSGLPLLIKSFSDNSVIWGTLGEPYNLKLTKTEKLKLFISDPYTHLYIPEEMYLQIQLYFIDGSTWSDFAKFKQQGW